MCREEIEYICIAQCSEDCLKNNINSFTTRYCKKLKTYNYCNECNVYVCKECYNELKLRNIKYCLICRANKNSDNIILQEVTYIVENRRNRLYNRLNNCIGILSYFKEDSLRCCRIIFIALLIIIIPITFSSIILLTNTGTEVIGENLPDVDNNEFLLMLLLMWCFGMIIIISCFCIIQCIRGKMNF